jgi:hypothetical protein
MKLSTLKQIEKQLQEMVKSAGSVDYDSYMKDHPRSKKQRNDPIFKQDGGKKPEKTKSVKEPHVEKALGMIKEVNDSDLNDALKKFQKGKITKEQLADVAEDWNHHGIAAILRADKNTDVDTIMHAQKRKDHLDDNQESYSGERSDALNARYEASSGNQGWKDDDSDRNRHLSALRYLHHHGLHDSPTAKRLQDKLNSNKADYQKAHAEKTKLMDQNLAREKNDLLNFKPDPKHPDWKKEDQLDHVMSISKAKDKHHEIGKKFGLE